MPNSTNTIVYTDCILYEKDKLENWNKSKFRLNLLSYLKLRFAPHYDINMTIFKTTFNNNTSNFISCEKVSVSEIKKALMLL